MGTLGLQEGAEGVGEEAPGVPGAAAASPGVVFLWKTGIFTASFFERDPVAAL